MSEKAHPDSGKFRLIVKMVSAEVRKRGGKIEVPISAIPALLTRGFNASLAKDVIEYTLKPDDGLRRDRTAFKNRLLYRLDVILKYLISTAPEGRLYFTNADVFDGKIQLSIGSEGATLTAHTEESPDRDIARAGTQRFLFRPENPVVVIRDLPAGRPKVVN